MRALRNLFFLTLLFLCQSAWAGKGTILYIPLDNRPVCLDYTVRSMEAAGWEIRTPRELLANERGAGDPEQLFAWLENNMDESVAVVASADALLYGGLVASRTHAFAPEILERRAERLVNLKQRYGSRDLYVFATIMRSPKHSAAPVEPDYYAAWGEKLFRMGELEDRRELKKLSRREARELAALRREVPQEIQDDHYERRTRNIMATELLLHGVESGDFAYFLIGRDDTAAYSQAHREARRMDILVRELPKERIRFFAGADQLGLVLLARAAHRLEFALPLVNVTYAPGAGGKTVAAYEDDALAESAKQHIYAAGAFPARLRRHADLVLAVNTPEDGKTLEAGESANTYRAGESAKHFASKLERLTEKYPVALADVRFGNGADNSLVKLLFQKNLAYKLAAYGGWNTASNTLGFALAQGLLSKDFAPEEKRTLLEERYLDDWAYQANVRMQLAQELIWPQRWPNSDLSDEQCAAAEEFITQRIKNLSTPFMGAASEKYAFSLPWRRMFEIKVEEK